MNLKVGVGRRAAVMVVITLVVAAGVGVTLYRSGKDEPKSGPADARSIALSEACTNAASDKLQPLVTLAGPQAKLDQVDGTDWKVQTSVNHQTKWGDNWYDVTCVVAWTTPTLKVKSVETKAR